MDAIFSGGEPPEGSAAPPLPTRLRPCYTSATCIDSVDTAVQDSTDSAVTFYQLEQQLLPLTWLKSFAVISLGIWLIYNWNEIHP